jgi:hypothetical protein
MLSFDHLGKRAAFYAAIVAATLGCSFALNRLLLAFKMLIVRVGIS